MAGRATLRASDADRERIAERLRKAAVEGRLLTHELEQRLEATFSARTYGELNAIVRDLPGRSLTVRGERRPLPRGVRPALAVAIAVSVALVAVVVAFVITGVVATWILWVVAGWWFFGRRRRRCASPPRRRHAGPGLPAR
jgi:Flp pilus assembly protein TadB